MNIAIVGTGYVGLVSGTSFVGMDMPVTCIDVDYGKIERLKKGVKAICEPGLAIVRVFDPIAMDEKVDAELTM